jgi:hypothetical protein
MVFSNVFTKEPAYITKTSPLGDACEYCSVMNHTLAIADNATTIDTVITLLVKADIPSNHAWL